MKSILAFVFYFCSLNAFAGPEDHISVQTCYSLKSSPVIAAIPARVCVEEISVNNVDTDSASLNIYSYFNQKYFENMKLSYLARRNENGFSFRAENVLAESYEFGCGSAEKATLRISGRVDNDGLGEASYLDVTARYETLADTCHSKSQVQVFEYIKE